MSWFTLLSITFKISDYFPIVMIFFVCTESVQHVSVDSWTSCERAAAAALSAAGVAHNATGWSLTMEHNGQLTGNVHHRDKISKMLKMRAFYSPASDSLVDNTVCKGKGPLQTVLSTSEFIP